MANKQYISIIRLFSFCDIPIGDDFNPARARKQLQVEFGIAQEGIIEVDGFHYTRQDVFEEIERPDFDKRLVFHQQIWESPQLLDLLEQNTVNVYTIGGEFEPFWSNPGFDDFFSPFFAGPFQYVSRALLAEHKLREMGEWLKYEDFLQPAEREEALRPLRIYLDENERLLRNVKGANFEIMREKVEHWFNTSWHLLFNNLPHELYDSKNSIVVLLINLMVAIQKTNRADCISLSDQLIDLTDIEENLRTTIATNHKAILSGGRSSNRTRVIWFVLWLGFMASRAATCNDSDSDRYKTIDKIQFQLPLDTAPMKGIRFSTDTSRIDSSGQEKKAADPFDKKFRKVDSTRRLRTMSAY